jgi:hypothetical protein
MQGDEHERTEDVISLLQQAAFLLKGEVAQASILCPQRFLVNHWIFYGLAPLDRLAEHVAQDDEVTVHGSGLADKGASRHIGIHQQRRDRTQLAGVKFPPEVFHATPRPHIAPMMHLSPFEVEGRQLRERTPRHQPLVQILPLGNLHLALAQHHLGELLIRADAFPLRRPLT